MKIRVEIKNDILGNSVFWEGDYEDVGAIRNIPARMTALNVRRDGKTRQFGMWLVSVVEEG